MENFAILFLIIASVRLDIEDISDVVADADAHAEVLDVYALIGNGKQSLNNSIFECCEKIPPLG
ncbi:MAG: hypothetical protein ACTSYI_03460 [Promethearchaeota archaeon]